MNRRAQLLSAWSGLLILAGFGIGIVALAQFIPPPAANDSVQEVVELYSEDTDRLRAGFALMMVAGAFFAPFSAAISMQLRRIEGRAGPMTYAQLAAGAANVVVVTIGAMVMAVASFRPDRDPDVLLALHDLAWFFFLMYVSPLIVQCLSIGVGIFSNPEQRVFPRWVGYFNFWAALLSFTGVLIPFFKSGPFAWQGIFEFWLAATVFFAWIVVMMIVTIRAINREAEAEAGTREVEGEPDLLAPRVEATEAT